MNKVNKKKKIKINFNKMKLLIFQKSITSQKREKNLFLSIKIGDYKIVKIHLIKILKVCKRLKMVFLNK